MINFMINFITIIINIIIMRRQQPVQLCFQRPHKSSTIQNIPMVRSNLIHKSSPYPPRFQHGTKVSKQEKQIQPIDYKYLMFATDQ